MRMYLLFVDKLYVIANYYVIKKYLFVHLCTSGKIIV